MATGRSGRCASCCEGGAYSAALLRDLPSLCSFTRRARWRWPALGDGATKCARMGTAGMRPRCAGALRVTLPRAAWAGRHCLPFTLLPAPCTSAPASLPFLAWRACRATLRPLPLRRILARLLCRRKGGAYLKARRRRACRHRAHRWAGVWASNAAHRLWYARDLQRRDIFSSAERQAAA